MEASRLIANMPALCNITDREKLLIYEKAGDSPYIIDLVAAAAKDVPIGNVLADIEIIQQEFVENTLLNKVYGWLPDDETRKFFRRASVFRMPVNKDFLAAVGGNDELIAHLMHKGMLTVVEEDMYGMHASIRTFGFKRLKEIDGTSGLRDTQITAAQMYLNAWMTSKNIDFLLESRWFYYTAGEYNKADKLVNILTERLHKWGFIVEIKDQAMIVYQQSKGTPTEEIAFATNQMVQEWLISNQEQMTQKVQDLIFILKSKIPSCPENKHIYDKIGDLMKEKDVIKQYGTLNILIALIPTAQMIGGNLVTGDYVGGDKIIATNSSIVSKSSFSNAVNNVRNAGNAEAAKAIEDLAKLIESTYLKDKKETLENVESIAEEAAKPNPKKGTLRALSESILNAVQKVPEIVEKATPLIKIISKLWLL